MGGKKVYQIETGPVHKMHAATRGGRSVPCPNDLTEVDLIKAGLIEKTDAAVPPFLDYRICDGDDSKKKTSR